MTATDDLTGVRFKRWTVVEFSHKVGFKKYWKCLCDCGNTANVRVDTLLNGGSMSCGCLIPDMAVKTHTKHGLSKREIQPSEYGIWQAMIQRCTNPNTKGYKNYGGRGVRVCDRWLGRYGFENFIEDMGYRPSKGYSIDRYPNNKTGNYEPSNCRWGTSAQQSRGKRNNRNITYNGETLCIKDMCKKYNIKSRSVYQKAQRSGITIERSFDFFIKRGRIRRGTSIQHHTRESNPLSD